MESLYAHALKLLVARPHSRYELRTKLIRVCQRRKTTKLVRVRSEYVTLNCSTVTDDILQKLENQSLINDKEFAKYWREQREQYRPRSTFQLQGELRSKGITTDIINDALTNYNELTAALRVGYKKRNAVPTVITKYLIGKGFQYTTTQQVVRKFQEEAQNPSFGIPDPTVGQEENEDELTGSSSDDD